MTTIRPDDDPPDRTGRGGLAAGGSGDPRRPTAAKAGRSPADAAPPRAAPPPRAAALPPAAAPPPGADRSVSSTPLPDSLSLDVAPGEAVASLDRPLGGPPPLPEPSPPVAVASVPAGRGGLDRRILFAILGAFAAGVLAVGLIVFVATADWSGSARARRAIDAWARIEDGRDPGTSPPELSDWIAAYGGQDGSDGTSGLDGERLEPALPLLHEVLLSRRVSPETIQDVERVNDLIALIEDLRAGAIDAPGLASIGIALPAAETAQPLLASLVCEKIRERADRQTIEGRLRRSLTIDQVQDWVAGLAVLASLARRQPSPDRAADPNADADPVPDDREAKASGLKCVLDREPTADEVDRFVQAVDRDPGVLAGSRSLADLRRRIDALVSNDATRPVSDLVSGPQPRGSLPVTERSARDAERAAAAARRREADLRVRAWDAFATRVEDVAEAPRKWPKKTEPLVLVSRIPLTDQVAWEQVALQLVGTQKTWQPRAEPGSGSREWRLIGLPKDDDAHWGTIRLEPAADGGSHDLVFIKEPDAPFICGFVPIVFIGPDLGSGPPNERRTAPLRIAPTVPK